jgi:hypothetical protein
VIMNYERFGTQGTRLSLSIVGRSSLLARARVQRRITAA